MFILPKIVIFNLFFLFFVVKVNQHLTDDFIMKQVRKSKTIAIIVFTWMMLSVLSIPALAFWAIFLW